MQNPLTAAEILDREFLEIRARLLDVAAALDRTSAGGASLADDPRLAAIRQAISALLEKGDGRAEQIQLIFSRPYDESWRRDFQLEQGGGT